MATNKSISFEDDLVFDLQHRAKELDLPFSVYINDTLKKFLFGKKNDVCDINTHINNIIILSNNILLLSKQIEHTLDLKIEQKKKDLKTLEERKKKFGEANYNKFIKLREKLTENNLLKDIESIDFSDIHSISSFRDKCKGKISIAEIAEYNRLKKMEDEE